MPRVFCPECAAEVPVDDEGRCFLGHQVQEVSGSAPSSRPDIQDAIEEPEPWVANVTSEDARAPADEAVDEPTAPAGRAAPVEEATPSSGEEAGTPRVGEVPDPTAEDEEVELDLDTLEQAVAEMGLTAEQGTDEGDEDAFAMFEDEPDAPAPDAPGSDAAEPEVEVHEGAVADVLETQGVAPDPEPEPEPPPEPEPEPEPAPAPEPEPAAEPEPDEPDEWAAFDDAAGPAAPEEEADRGPGEEDGDEDGEDGEPVDTANFLARPKGKRRGLFGR